MVCGDEGAGKDDLAEYLLCRTATRLGSYVFAGQLIRLPCQDFKVVGDRVSQAVSRLLPNYSNRSQRGQH